MFKTNTRKTPNPLLLLKERVKQNYADFKAEVLSLMDEEEIYDAAHRIAAVKDTYEQLTGDSEYLDEDDAAFLLKFYNPLEMVADYLQEQQSGYPVEIDEALMELYNDDDHEENYLTVDFADELIGKYGDNVRMKMALLLETIEAGERYVRLLRLSNNSDAEGVCGYSELAVPFKPIDFDEDGFFTYDNDKEGCF